MKIFLSLFLLVSVSLSNAQSLPDFTNFNFKTKEDYKNAESNVRKAADYILTRKILPGDNTRALATLYIMKWMEGTPDYTFELDGTASKLPGKNNTDLFGVYMAALVKYRLDHPAEKPEQQKLGTVQIFLDYVSNTSNGVTLTKYMNKLLKARADGILAEVLNK